MAKIITIPDDVADVLSRCTQQGNVVRLPEGQLERPLYLATDKVLKAFGENLNTNGGDEVMLIDLDLANTQALEALKDWLIGDVSIAQDDFLRLAPMLKEHFDVILMNPPFSRNQDVEHVNAAIQLLAPGGILVAIMSPHWTFAMDDASRDFRDRLSIFKVGPGEEIVAANMSNERSGLHVKIERLPENTFASEGTNVRTVLVTIRK